MPQLSYSPQQQNPICNVCKKLMFVRISYNRRDLIGEDNQIIRAFCANDQCENYETAIYVEEATPCLEDTEEYKRKELFETGPNAEINLEEYRDIIKMIEDEEDVPAQRKKWRFRK